MTDLDVLIGIYRDIVSHNKDGRQSVELIIERLCSDLHAGVAVIDRDGRVVRLLLQDRFNPFDRREGDALDIVLAEQLNDLREDILNVSMDAVAVRTSPKNMLKNYKVSIFLLEAFGERYGSLVVFVRGTELTSHQVSLSNYAATLISLIVMEKYSRESFERKHKLEDVRAVCETLSYSELMAAVSIFAQLKGDEGLIVASRIADSEGITRSVIVNAIRKLEGAGIIESRSLGMKGTYIKVLNEYFAKEMLKIKK